jgi:Tol biopolymer transport system component
VYSSGDVYVADLQTNTVKRVAEGAFAELRGPMAWSPDGTRIALRNSQRLGGGDQLLVLDTTTGQSTSYTGDLPAGLVEQYAWAPDSSAVAFTWNDGSFHLYVAIAAGGALRDLGPAWGGTPPAWSPDGTWIAATQVLDVFSSVFIARTDGSDRRQIAGELHQSNNPAWAPDSKHLAFEGAPSDDFNDRHLFVTDVTGGTPRELANGTTLAFSPLIAFSNDGRRALFTAPPTQHNRLPAAAARIALRSRCRRRDAPSARTRRVAGVLSDVVARRFPAGRRTGRRCATAAPGR